jgi:hypothetical protein
MRSLQHAGEREGGAFAVGYSVDDFAAAVDAVTAGEIFGVGRLTSGAVDLNAAGFDSYAATGF